MMNGTNYRIIMPGAVDANFHIAWSIIHNAIEDFGVKELKLLARGESVSLPGESSDVAQQVGKWRERVRQETLHGALRISALVRLLTFESRRSRVEAHRIGLRRLQS
jgi:hypothetical protein